MGADLSQKDKEWGQDRDYRWIWSRSEYLSKAKERRGSEEKGLQVKEGGAEVSTETIWVTQREGTEKKQGWERPSEVRDEKAW